LLNVITELPQERHVVDHPETAAMRSHDQIVSMNSEIAHRSRRQIQLQRLPVIAIVKRHEHIALSACEQKPTTMWIFLHCLHVNTGGQSARDLGPCFAGVECAIDVRLVISELMALDRSVSLVHI